MPQLITYQFHNFSFNSFSFVILNIKKHFKNKYIQVYLLFFANLNRAKLFRNYCQKKYLAAREFSISKNYFYMLIL